MTHTNGLRLLPVAALLGMTALLAACGGPDPTTTTTTQQTTTQQTIPAVPSQTTVTTYKTQSTP